MKIQDMKKLNTKWQVVLLCFLMIAVCLQSCKNYDDNPNYDCGCNSETLDTVPSENFPEVPDEEQTLGVMFYKTSDKIDGNYDYEEYNNRFWIFRGVEGCHNCQHHFIVCNEELLGAEFNYLKNINDSIEVVFKGDLKSLCTLRAIPADYNYSEISLTSIE